MIGTQAVIEGVIAWAREVIPALNAGFDYEPLQKTNSLPDVVGIVTESLTEIGDTDFPLLSIQQTYVQRYNLSLSFMVDNSDPQAAAILLREWADALRAALVQDGTLGDRVPIASPFITFDFTPPFVEYADGTRGREMTMTLRVAEQLEVHQ